MTMQSKLPAKFCDLERFVDIWAKPTVNERIAARGTNSMEGITEFYEVVIERAPEILEFLENFPLNDLPEDARILLQILLGLAHAAISVEIQGQPLPPKTEFPLDISLISGITPFG